MISNLNIEIDKEKYIIVGASAGPDSMALLHYLSHNTNNTIVCCHINHNIRKQSHEEEEYLKKYCEKNNIIFESTTIKKYYENNFENEARKKRYEFFHKIINKYNAKYLFLAHHGDDLIETILMKIIRGSNLEGYAGIKEISKNNNYYIIRPFLKYNKEDLINYNKKHSLNYYIDRSNFDTKYTRNRIRKNILPALKKENSNIHLSFFKYSNTLLEYNNYIKKETTSITKKIYKNNKLLIDKFIKLDVFMKKNILYSILIDYYNNLCIKEYNYLYFKKAKQNNNNYKIELKDKISIGNHLITKINKTDTNGNNICRLNSKNINLPIYVRNRKNGDYIELHGTKGKKKIKDIFIDKKIPTTDRNNYPIVVDSNDNILWIPNLKKSKFNIQKDKFCDIILKYCEKEENNE